MTWAEATDDYTQFHIWKRTHEDTLRDWWGDYLDDPQTPGIMSGFESFCQQAYAAGVKP
jgi:hypothetical protein